MTSTTSTRTARAPRRTTARRPRPSRPSSDERAYAIPVSSTKSMTGHMLGAGGGVEAIACIRAIGGRHPAADDQPRDARSRVRPRLRAERGAAGPMHVAMSNSFGFGGHNATLVFRTVSTPRDRAGRHRGGACGRRLGWRRAFEASRPRRARGRGRRAAAPAGEAAAVRRPAAPRLRPNRPHQPRRGTAAPGRSASRRPACGS